MEFSVVTGKDGKVEVWLSADGRLTDAGGQVIFTDRQFADAMDADYWLNFCDDFAKFMGAYIANGVHSTGRDHGSGQGLTGLVVGCGPCNSRATGFASPIQSIKCSRWSVPETGGGLSGHETPVADLSRTELV